jgi:hypothetical protein
MVLFTHLNAISDPCRREGRRFDLPHSGAVHPPLLLAPQPVLKVMDA